MPRQCREGLLEPGILESNVRVVSPSRLFVLPLEALVLVPKLDNEPQQTLGYPDSVAPSVSHHAEELLSMWIRPYVDYRTLSPQNIATLPSTPARSDKSAYKTLRLAR